VYVDDIVGNREAVDRLKVIAREGNMPNIILSVPALLAVARCPPLPPTCIGMHWDACGKRRPPACLRGMAEAAMMQVKTQLSALSRRGRRGQGRRRASCASLMRCWGPATSRASWS
jgi:hypothetical protein